MIFSTFIKKRWPILLAATILLTAGTAVVISYLNRSNEEVVKEEEKPPDPTAKEERIRLDLTASISDQSGIDLKTDFKLKFPDSSKLDEKIIKDGLKIVPAIDYELEIIDDGIAIKPISNLLANKVYTFKINLPEKNIKESWAFQTRREFKIISAFPRDKATNVPLNSGIEVTFSHADITDFDKNFSIEPKVEGRFEIHKNIAVFVPKKLDVNTIYTVTIGNGAGAVGVKEKLKEDYSFSFQTQTNIPEIDYNRTYLSVYDSFYNFPSDIQPVLEVGASDDLLGKDMDISVYRYDNADSFIKDYDAINKTPYWAVFNRIDLIPDLSATKPFKQYKQPLTTVEYINYVALPESLPEGYYLLVLKIDEKLDYSFVQINNIQLFFTTGEKQSVIWLNDMISGEPVSGAEFEGNGIKKVTTGKDGTAVINDNIYKGNTERTLFFKASAEGHTTMVVPLSGWRDYWNEPEYASKSFWSTIYLDKSTYLPTDAVKVWGFLKPRNGDGRPKSVTVNLIKDSYDYRTFESGRQTLETREVLLSPEGSYTTGFTFEDLPSASYGIEVVHEDEIIGSKYLYVTKYVKSPYIVSVNPQYKAYFAGENLDAEVSCEFFEGTPVPGYEMNYSIHNYSDYNSRKNGVLTLDAQGKGNIRGIIPENANVAMSWKPINHTLYVSNRNPEETEVYDNEYFSVFPRDVMAEVDIDFNENTANLHFKTNSIDLTKARETDELYDSDGKVPYKGLPVDRIVKATLYERYWDQKETGEYYDIINKKNVAIYDYFEVKNALQSFEIQTINGKADYTLTISDYTNKKGYYLEYETKDSKNRLISESAWIYGYDNYWYGYGYNHDFYYLQLNKTEAKYKIGEKINFSLKKNNNESVDSGRTLYLVMQEGVKDLWTADNAEQSIDFDDGYMPNSFVKAIHFDGRLIHNAYERQITFDYSDKELDIELKTDKESYKPGDTVNATVTVKDKAGRPVATDVNLSVVDEAYFDLYDQSVDTIADLYGSVYYTGIQDIYVSYQDFSRGPGGAEGGEGDDRGGRNNVRKNFVDNAFFDTKATNRSGKAEISFKLPDNLTSWRITYQAVTEDLMAGSGKKNITVRLPFFVKAVMNDIFLVGDSPTLLLKGYGEGISENDKIAFKVDLKDADGLTQTFTAEGKQDVYTEISLPKLNEGDYSITVEGKSGSFSDAVERNIQVRKSLLLAKQVDYHKLTQDLTLSTINSYSTLSFYNAELGDYYRSLTNLYWSYGSRLDQIVARNEARELLNLHFPEGYYNYGEKTDVRPYQKEDGGFALFPYGSSDVELSAKMAALCGNEINTGSLINYFSNITENSETTPLQVSAAYWGLASLREPVLLDLRGFIAEDELSLDEKLYIANALAELGDLNEAVKLYDEISNKNGYVIEPYRYINDGGDNDDILRWTSLMALLAIKVDADDMMDYFKYIEAKSTDEILINLERLILVKQELPSAVKPAGFSFEVHGRKESISISGIEPYTIMLSPEKLKTLKFSEIQGDVTLSVSYETLNDKITEPVVTVDRRYNRVSSPVTLGRTDTVSIDLDLDFSKAAPEGYYEITDVLPAGLRYIYPFQTGYEKWYYGKPDDGQRVKLYWYFDGKEDKKTISYSARVSAPGDYTADRALVKHSESDARGYSEKTSIRIR